LRREGRAWRTLDPARGNAPSILCRNRSRAYRSGTPPRIRHRPGSAGGLLAYAEEHMNAWDCLAGLLLVEEAGGRIVRPDPATVVSKGTLVIAARDGVFDRLADLCEIAFKR